MTPAAIACLVLLAACACVLLLWSDPEPGEAVLETAFLAAVVVLLVLSLAGCHDVCAQGWETSATAQDSQRYGHGGETTVTIKGGIGRKECTE